MPIFVLATLFIVGLLVASIEFGRRIRSRSREQKFSSGPGVIDGAVFGLMALLLGFSSSGAVSRFDARRELIVQETNAVGTAWLRVDLLPEAAQPQIRDDFRTYLDNSPGRTDLGRDHEASAVSDTGPGTAGHLWVFPAGSDRSRAD